MVTGCGPSSTSRRGAVCLAFLCGGLMVAGAQKVVLCFGDSLTAGVGASGPGASYPAQLQAMLGGGWTVVNSGVGGETSGQGLGRIGGAVAAASPTHVLICEGANDVTGAGSPEGTAGNIQQMVAVVRGAGARAIVGTLPPRMDLYRASSFAFSDAIIRAATAAGAGLADLEGAMIGKEAQYVGTDRLHLTDAGYRKMASVFRGKMGGGGSSGDGDGGGGGCFVATAVYGDPEAPQLAVLRRVRDEWLLSSRAGSAFVEWYYREGPDLARQLMRDEASAVQARGILDMTVRAAEWALARDREPSREGCR